MPISIHWTKMAQDDLRSIRNHISRHAPATATAYTRKLRRSVERLKNMPFSGQVVPEIKLASHQKDLLQRTFTRSTALPWNELRVGSAVEQAGRRLC